MSLKGSPSPNPYVGAVVVKDGRIVGEGYHRRVGEPHAEVEALKDVNGLGTTLYVTLEPCSHHGRTPPCTQAIIDAGVSEVVYAVEDPTDKVKGREVLGAEGVEVRSGVLKEECEKANEVFMKYSKTGRPFVVLKAAVSLDGQIASKTGDSRWITSGESREIVHELRGRYDAVLVGVGTVLKDNPQLTCRTGGRDPLRIVLDSGLRTPLDANVLADDNVLMVTTKKAGEKVEEYGGKAEVVVAGEDTVDLKALLSVLAERNITSVLVEGGSQVNYSFAKAGLVDKYVFFTAPKLLLGCNTPVFGGEGVNALADALNLRFDSVKRVGSDVMLEAYPLK